MNLLKVLTISILMFSLAACTKEASGTQDVMMDKIEQSQVQQHWVLMDIDGQPIDPQVESTLNISPLNKASGKMACNNFFGVVTLQDNRMKVENMGSTRRMCQASKMGVENTVSTVLTDWSEVSIVEDRLTLVGKSHQLSYQRQQ